MAAITSAVILESPKKSDTVSPSISQEVMGPDAMIPDAAAAAKSLQSCPTLCDPRDDSSPGSPIPGILQARTLELVAISSNA